MKAISSYRPIVITGNWKMYKTIPETTQFIQKLACSIEQCSAEQSSVIVLLAVPFTSIFSAAQIAEETDIMIGAQNLNDKEEGPYTGEISAKMLKEAGAQFVIVGHSERRQLYGETDPLINKKIHQALHHSLVPILCIGETLEDRESGKTEQILSTQLTQCLKEITIQQINKIMIAYEPIWAIGTGKNATPERAQETHQFCRQFIAKKWGNEAAENIVIQYGGSVKASNAKTLLEQNDIDGLLVGGASLEIDSFSKIINFENTITC